ncbi:26S proteasome regulatory subunit 4 [Hondaea fermentalgiana]|uniref:26S proteasome regulatory subunit 4 n=1 Tax=Hondaea fermentalgiana TaxID=2315210 RepID=A0A2R5GQ29_9STRA|nr:26S proteasome regulatory subunit 4 [Hondaea fermentalgiana]|eukprot:GBG32960.1 26S proteasome regulatory subunit 4 [Hondaea fermentalgiana]
MAEAAVKLAHVEICLTREAAGVSKANREEIARTVEHALRTQLDMVHPETKVSLSCLTLAPDVANCIRDIVVDCEESCPCWNAQFVTHVFALHEEGSYDETTEDDPTSTVFTHWELPAQQFHGLWESLEYEAGIKPHLLEFASTSLLFSSRQVDHNLISWNHVVLLHGPPGTGKTSLCQAMAQKLSVRLSSTFARAELLEVNSHSLFSKWFSESGKLVSKLFSYIHELAEDEETLVCILIDEVESLAAARSASMNGSEPSDSIRVVNSLLTQLDRLKSRKNVIVLTTSNITEAIDVAFVDRADIRQYIGLPVESVRRSILRSCIVELQRAGVVAQDELSAEAESALDDCARATHGLSGRGLRKLPFQAHARFIRSTNPASLVGFLRAIHDAARAEAASSVAASAATSTAPVSAA